MVALKKYQAEFAKLQNQIDDVKKFISDVSYIFFVLSSTTNSIAKIVEIIGNSKVFLKNFLK